MTEVSTLEAAPNSQADNREAIVYPPLAPWQVFLLCSLTFTLYASFWMYRAASDLEKLDTEKRTKWLWFLSPLVGISVWWSVPRLLERYDAVIGEERWALKAIGIAALIFAGAFIISLANSLEIPGWLTAGAVVAVSGAFAWLQVATNELKRGLPESRFTRRAFRFSVVHWVTLITCSAILITGGYALYVLEAELGDGEAVPAGSFQRIPDHNVSLLFEKAGWERLAIGSYSDGSASAEFRGPTDDQWVLVYDQGPDRNIEDWLRFRRDAAENDEDMTLTCKEEVTTTPDTIDLVAMVVCSGDYWTDPAIEIYHLRSINGNYWEALGHLSAPKLTFQSNSDALKKIIQSLNVATSSTQSKYD